VIMIDFIVCRAFDGRVHACTVLQIRSNHDVLYSSCVQQRLGERLAACSQCTLVHVPDQHLRICSVSHSFWLT
jgi:hypothetical protein